MAPCFLGKYVETQIPDSYQPNFVHALKSRAFWRRDQIVWMCVLSQWRIQDFPQGGAPTPKSAIIFQIFAENCMKMKEFGPPGGGARPWRPPLDPPMLAYSI